MGCSKKGKARLYIFCIKVLHAPENDLFPMIW